MRRMELSTDNQALIVKLLRGDSVFSQRRVRITIPIPRIPIPYFVTETEQPKPPVNWRREGF